MLILLHLQYEKKWECLYNLEVRKFPINLWSHPLLLRISSIRKSNEGDNVFQECIWFQYNSSLLLTKCVQMLGKILLLVWMHTGPHYLYKTQHTEEIPHTYHIIVPPVLRSLTRVGRNRRGGATGRCRGALTGSTNTWNAAANRFNNPRAEIGNCQTYNTPNPCCKSKLGKQPMEVYWSLVTSNSILLLAMLEFLLVRMWHRLLKSWII